MVANWFISKLTGVKLKDYGCTLKAYRKEIVNHINLYGEMHRFIPALASWAGAKVAEIEVNHHPRRKGSSKYGTSRILKVVLDLITVKFLLTFSTRPIHVFGFLGIMGIFAGLGIAANNESETSDAILLVTGVFIGSTLWWVLLISAAAILRGKLTTKGLMWVNRISGIIICGFGLIALGSLIIHP